MDLVLAVPPSALAPHSLETIPGSADQTPASNEEEPPPPEVLQDETVELLENVVDGPSRRSSLGLELVAMPGSYFPSAVASTSFNPSSSHVSFVSSPSGASTPGRPRPTPISIPLATPDEPLFSAYPETGGLSRTNSKGKGKERAHFLLAPTFSLSRPPSRKKDRESDQQANPPSPSDTSPDSSDKPRGRRRALSASHAHPPRQSVSSETTPHRRRSLRSPKQVLAHIPHSRTFGGFHSKRRSIDSVTAEIAGAVDQVTDWTSMESQVSDRFEQPHLEFSYNQPNSDYTLQSVSTITTTRPLETPVISPRKSSLSFPSNAADAHAQTSSLLLGLTDMAHSVSPDEVIPEDFPTSIPHAPPPRRSSLSLSKPIGIPGLEDPSDHHSLLSASITTTETTASIDAFSPCTTDHPLSSASTSLSRSAKSGKEGDDKESHLSAVRLQRSLEWEAKQDKQRRRVEKRRMILLELVETEISYVEDLKILVQIYLPQLAALGLPDTTVRLVARNTGDLLFFHTQFARRMVDVLREEGLGLEDIQSSPDARSLGDKVERVARRIAALFIEDCSGFAAYNDFCAGSIAAATLVRNISQRSDYGAFEKRCQIISSSQSYVNLRELLSDEPTAITASNRSRLRFKDFLIMPIQRVCRYPMLLASLLGSAPSPITEDPFNEAENADDIGVDVERALSAMRSVAEEADESRRLKETEIKSATVLERMELHPILTAPFLRSLGTCRLIGALDVLHHHPTLNPLVPPVKVKYLAAFLFRGYLILAKVKKGKVYEAKHFLPLEVFEMIDITEGFLPHSIRLTLREHNFDLAASCESEKDVWATAVCEARDESTVPPFELPASVSPFAARSRRVSTFGQLAVSDTTSAGMDFVPPSPSRKRHTLAGIFDGDTALDLETLSKVTTASSPTRTTFNNPSPGTAPRTKPNTILLRRASASQRLIVDRGLVDVFSESCSTARSKAQMHHTLFLPEVNPGPELRHRLSLKESTVLRRRRSFLDSRSSSGDIVSTGEFKGSIMPLRQSRSNTGSRRSATVGPAARVRSESTGGTESNTEVGEEGGDDTAMEISDFGSIGGHQPSRSNSFASIASTTGSTRERVFPYPPSFASGHFQRLSRGNSSSDRQFATVREARSPIEKFADSRRKTASVNNLNGARPPTPSRAKSMPVSPVVTPDPDMGHHVRLTADVITHSHSGYFPTIPSESASPSGSSSNIYALGNGFTNQSNSQSQSSSKISSTPASPWKALRRNLSSLRNMSVLSHGSPSKASLDLARDEASDGEGVDGLGAKPDEEAGEGQEEDGTVYHRAVPKRRRSLKMLAGGLRFTPI